jgi:MtN3 and saliva related transmembrane protein
MQMNEYIIFIIGISATFFSLWSTVPQIRKSLRTKKTDDVSKWLIISLIVGLSLWVLYGIVKGDIVIAVANAIGVTLNLILLFLKLKYMASNKQISDSPSR